MLVSGDFRYTFAVPTIISHPVVAVGVYPWLQRHGLTRSVLVAGALLTMLPDIDVIGYWLGIPYSHMLGHRGLSHSLPFAIVVSGLVALFFARYCAARVPVLWFYFAVCLASHGLFDALTDGGLGIAFFAPFSNERYFFDVNPLRVSVLAPSRFLTERMLNVLISEIIWVWLPFSLLAAGGWLFNRRRRHRNNRIVGSVETPPA